MASASLLLPLQVFAVINAYLDVNKIFEKRLGRVTRERDATHAFVDAYELRAYKNQLDNFKNRNCSPEHMIGVALKIRKFSNDTSPIIVYKFDKDGNVMSEEKIEM